MKLLLKKPTLHNDIVYREESVINMVDEGRAKFMCGMGYAVEAPKDTPLTNYAPAEIPRPITAVDVGEAVAKAISKGMTFPVDNKP